MLSRLFPRFARTSSPPPQTGRVFCCAYVLKGFSDLDVVTFGAFAICVNASACLRALCPIRRCTRNAEAAPNPGNRFVGELPETTAVDLGCGFPGRQVRKLPHDGRHFLVALRRLNEVELRQEWITQLHPSRLGGGKPALVRSLIRRRSCSATAA